MLDSININHYNHLYKDEIVKDEQRLAELESSASTRAASAAA